MGSFVFGQWSLHLSLFENNFEWAPDGALSYSVISVFLRPCFLDKCLSALFGDGGLPTDGSKLLNSTFSDSAPSAENGEDVSLLWDARPDEDSQTEPLELKAWPVVE